MNSLLYKYSKIYSVLSIMYGSFVLYLCNVIAGFRQEGGFTCPHTLVQIPRKTHWETQHYQASQVMTCLQYTAALARRKFGVGFLLLPCFLSLSLTHTHKLLSLSLSCSHTLSLSLSPDIIWPGLVKMFNLSLSLKPVIV